MNDEGARHRRPATNAITASESSTGEGQRNAGVGAGPVGTARERAHALLTFCDGVEAAAQVAGVDRLVEYAQRSRDVARELLGALDQLDAERSARVQIQAQRDEAVRILGKRSDDMAKIYARAAARGIWQPPDMAEAS